MSTIARALSTSASPALDALYPGTAVARLSASRAAVSSASLAGDWSSVVRPRLLDAAGLHDFPNARTHPPGGGYTGHSFNDWNHCAVCTMNLDVKDEENNNRVVGIHSSNKLGAGIAIASKDNIGAGGSWTTCMQNCGSEPPADVCHVQFRSRAAWYLIWVPPTFETFVVVDDDGNGLNVGRPTGELPPKWERKKNFEVVERSKYGKFAIAQSILDKAGPSIATTFIDGKNSSSSGGGGGAGEL